MKRYFIILLLALASCSNSDNNNKPAAPPQGLPATLVNNPHTANGVDTVAAARKPIMSFQDTVHNFGTIHEDEVVQYEFAFTNTGQTPLFITNASGSCGCTVPDYPRDAVAPGKSGVIKVTFNSAGKSGHQEKSVTIHANTMKNIEMLFIKADVEKKK